MFNLLNRELSFEVDMNAIGCGMNAALFFIAMPERTEWSNQETLELNTELVTATPSLFNPVVQPAQRWTSGRQIAWAPSTPLILAMVTRTVILTVVASTPTHIWSPELLLPRSKLSSRFDSAAHRRHSVHHQWWNRQRNASRDYMLLHSEWKTHRIAFCNIFNIFLIVNLN